MNIEDQIQADFNLPQRTTNSTKLEEYKRSPLRVFCPYCGAEYTGNKSFLGQKAICSRCSKYFIVGQTPENIGLQIPSNTMSINDYMWVAHGCKMMGNLQAARHMTAEAMDRNPRWIRGLYFLASADILLHEYYEAAKSLFTYVECVGWAARQNRSEYNYTIRNQYQFLASPFWGKELQIGHFLLPKNYYYDMLFDENGNIDVGDEFVRELLDCVYMLVDYSEIFEHLGHCYIHRYPEKFSRYPSLFGEVAAKFESEVLNNPPKEPAVYPWELKHISCITGLSYALANISRYENLEEVLRASKSRFIKDMCFFGGNAQYIP